jgi:hypothetical protein
MKRNITYTSMVHTDGTRTTFGAYRAKLYYAGGRPHRVECGDRVGTVETMVEPRPDTFYLDVARQFETPDHPAFSWELKDDPAWRLLDANDIRTMTGWDLLEAVGLHDGCATRTGEEANFRTVQRPDRECTVWATTGRGRNRGVYVHWSAEFPVYLTFPDGKSYKSGATQVRHFRVKADDAIEDYKEV